MQAFSRSYFERLLEVPGLTTLGAFRGAELVSVHLWLDFESHLYSHLAASSPLGYELRASYAINDAVLERYGPSHVIDFGSSAGARDDPEQGLARFKRGFSNQSAPCFLCGKILLAEEYGALSAGRDSSDYFPRYRAAVHGTPPR